MITITVKKRNGNYLEFVSKGHAGYAEEGQEDDGYVSFHFTAPVTERGTLLMDSLILGLTEIEHSYNNRYLTVKVKEV